MLLKRAQSPFLGVFYRNTTINLLSLGINKPTTLAGFSMLQLSSHSQISQTKADTDVVQCRLRQEETVIGRTI